VQLVEGGQTWRKIDRSGPLSGRPLPSSGKETAEHDDDDDGGSRTSLRPAIRRSHVRRL